MKSCSGATGGEKASSRGVVYWQFGIRKLNIQVYLHLGALSYKNLINPIKVNCCLRRKQRNYFVKHEIEIPSSLNISDLPLINYFNQEKMLKKIRSL